jgi:uncharacterized cupredoxin-like copper-binding protein
MFAKSAGPPDRRPLLAVGIAAGTLALTTLAACGSQSSPGSAGSTTSTAAGATGSATGSQVTVTLSEYHIALSQSTFTAGQYTFVAKNAGGTTHSFEINGPGVSGQHTPELSPGQSADLTVTLSAGNYDAFCPVDGHQGLGMDTHFTVGGAGAGAPATSAPQTTSPAGGGGGYGGY